MNYHEHLLKGIPESQETFERIKFIQEEIEYGIDLDTSIGIHGTSLNSLIEGIKTGFIPGSKPHETDIEDPNSRDLYLYPFQRHADKFSLDVAWLEERDAWGQAVSYAETLGHTHALLSYLGLPIENINDMGHHARRIVHHGAIEEHYNSYDIAIFYQLNEIWSLRDMHLKSIYEEIDELQKNFDHFTQMGFSYEHILAQKNKAMKFKGVTLGLDPRILEDYEVLLGDHLEGDVRIRSPHGLDIRYITGCYVPGPLEKQVIKKWGRFEVKE